MPRQSVISITIKAVVPYDKDTFGEVGKAEDVTLDFEKQVRDQASACGVTITEFTPRHTSVEK